MAVKIDHLRCERNVAPGDLYLIPVTGGGDVGRGRKIEGDDEFNRGDWQRGDVALYAQCNDVDPTAFFSARLTDKEPLSAGIPTDGFEDFSGARAARACVHCAGAESVIGGKGDCDRQDHCWSKLCRLG